MDETCVEAFPSCSCFLCCDWLWLAAGSESGRSSPYYGQEGRSSTPTTNQPPKHFHVPGRTPHRLTALLIISYIFCFYSRGGRFHQPLFTNANHSQRSLRVPWEWGGVKMSYFYTARNCSGIVFPSYYIFTFFYLPLQPSLHLRSSQQKLTSSPSSLFHVSPHLLFLSSATGDPNIYRKPPIYQRAGTVQLASP